MLKLLPLQNPNSFYSYLIIFSIILSAFTFIGLFLLLDWCWCWCWCCFFQFRTVKTSARGKVWIRNRIDCCGSATCASSYHCQSRAYAMAWWIRLTHNNGQIDPRSFFSQFSIVNLHFHCKLAKSIMVLQQSFKWGEI